MAPVHEAAYKNDVEKLGRLLVTNPGLIEAGHSYSRTPLYYACCAGAVDAARLLLHRRADMNRMDSVGWTPLMEACYCGRAKLVSLLISRGTGALGRTRGGLTALMAASSAANFRGSDHVGVLRLLIKDGRVPIDARDKVRTHGTMVGLRFWPRHQGSSAIDGGPGWPHHPGLMLTVRLPWLSLGDDGTRAASDCCR